MYKTLHKCESPQDSNQLHPSRRYTVSVTVGILTLSYTASILLYGVGNQLESQQGTL